MKHQRGSKAYNQQFHGNGTSRAIRIARDSRIKGYCPSWLKEISPLPWLVSPLKWSEHWLKARTAA